MKKRFWFGFAVVPVLLVGVAFWARRASWTHMEQTYQREIATLAVRESGTPGVAITIGHRSGHFGRLGSGMWRANVGVWSRTELQNIVSDIHLVPQPKGATRVDDHDCFYLLGPPYLLAISLDEDRGEFIKAGTRQADQLRAIALSPATCRALKRRIQAQFGHQLGVAGKQWQDFKRQNPS